MVISSASSRPSVYMFMLLLSDVVRLFSMVWVFPRSLGVYPPPIAVWQHRRIQLPLELHCRCSACDVQHVSPAYMRWGLRGMSWWSVWGVVCKASLEARETGGCHPTTEGSGVEGPGREARKISGLQLSRRPTSPLTHLLTKTMRRQRSTPALRVLSATRSPRSSLPLDRLPLHPLHYAARTRPLTSRSGSSLHRP
jgi:hypothetical protein